MVPTLAQVACLAWYDGDDLYRAANRPPSVRVIEQCIGRGWLRAVSGPSPAMRLTEDGALARARWDFEAEVALAV